MVIENNVYEQAVAKATSPRASPRNDGTPRSSGSKPRKTTFVTQELPNMVDLTADSSASSSSSSSSSAKGKKSKKSSGSTSTKSHQDVEAPTSVFLDEDQEVATHDDFESQDDGYSNRALFRRAYQYLKPGPIFRTIVWIYGERKLAVFFLLHFIATMVTWGHFALIKWEEQKAAVPEGAPFYWWKRIAPPLEFGSMHAILLQMALIPLTMSRFSIAAMTDSFLDRYVPLNRMVRIHIHLGYVMVGIVFLATVFFFVFFGLLCANGDEAFCDKFTSEIMCTGYGILATLLIIGGTSYFRYKIPYEVFYVIHHLVFAMYAITIVHTFDSVQRNNGRNRSQTFKWFSTTILYYVCDRLAMHLNHRYRTQVSSSTAVKGSDGSRMLILKIQRPVLFQFKPGQYAFLKVSSLDQHWHPFSIASSPSSNELEFYVEVFAPKTWTGKLWDILEGGSKGGTTHKKVEIEVMGPYGTSLGNTNNYSHGLAIGAGTGIVPVLSMFKQHAQQILRLSPSTHLKNLEEVREQRAEYELAFEERKGSLVDEVVGGCRSCRVGAREKVVVTKADRIRKSIRDSVSNYDMIGLDGQPTLSRRSAKELQQAAYEATKSLYGVVSMGLLTTLGLALVALTISWNTLPIEIYDGMVSILELFSVIFQFSFGFAAAFVWDKNSMLCFVDMAVCLIAVPADIYWFRVYDERGALRPVDIATFSLLTCYMVGRLWTKAVCPRHVTWQQGPGADRSSSAAPAMECLKVVWVSRSATLIAEILPEIDEIWREIQKRWKLEDAMKVIQFSVYCTDKDKRATSFLIKQISKTKLYKQGFVHLGGRPNFGEILEDHTLELIDQSRSSNTLFAFCGSPMLARHLHKIKTSNDMVAAITGHKKHQVEFVSESYGGVRSSSKKKATSSSASSAEKAQRAKKTENGDAKKTRSQPSPELHPDQALLLDGSMNFSPGDLSTTSMMMDRHITQFVGSNQKDPLGV